MLIQLKQFLRQLIPPLFVAYYKNHLRNEGFFGEYATYEEAKKISGSYSDELILEGIKGEYQSYIAGQVKPQIHAWPLLAALLKASSKLGSLKVMDFGGSLGATYFQFYDFLKDVPGFSWNVVELESLVTYGQEKVMSPHLKFYHNIDICMENQHPNVLVLGGVLQLIEEPYLLLVKLISSNFDYILLDRTILSEFDRDIVKVQKVSATLFGQPIMHPAWVLSRGKFMNVFQGHYNLLASFKTDAPFPDNRCSYNFMMFERKQL